MTSEELSKIVMSAEDFARLKERAKKDLEYDWDTAAEKCRRISSIYQDWLDVFNRESAKFVVLEIEKDKLYGKLYKEYRFESNLKFDSNKEIESQIKCDPEWVKLSAASSKQKLVVDYLQDTLGNINRLSFSIKNFIEIMKVRGGFGL